MIEGPDSNTDIPAQIVDLKGTGYDEFPNGAAVKKQLDQVRSNTSRVGAPHVTQMPDAIAGND